MTKQSTRWPLWKIIVGTAGCAAISAVLFWLSALADKAVGKAATQPSTPGPVITLSSLLGMIAMGMAILGVLGLFWLAVRINEARKPAWERGRKKKRR